MIQFNLLPDVKLEFVKTTRIKRLVMTVSAIIALVAAGIAVILFLFVIGYQKNHISSQNSKITSEISSLKSTSNLSQMLTVQNQLNTIPKIDDAKPNVTQLPNYIGQLTPPKATISTFNLEFTPNDTITFTGQADSLATVQQFVDNIKAATFTVGSASKQAAFTDVVLSNFGYSTIDGATYTITANFNPDIFSSTGTVNLNVPNTVTRSGQPLFKANTSSNNNGNS